MDFPKLINITELAKLSKVTYSKIYFRKNGYTKGEMDLKDRTRIVNSICSALKPFFKDLGFELTLHRMEDQ